MESDVALLALTKTLYKYALAPDLRRDLKKLIEALEWKRSQARS